MLEVAYSPNAVTRMISRKAVSRAPFLVGCTSEQVTLVIVPCNLIGKPEDA